MPNQIDLAKTVRPIPNSSGKLGTAGAKGVATGLLLLMLLSLSAIVMLPVMAAGSEEEMDVFEQTDLQRTRYALMLEQYKENGYKPVEGIDIEIPAVNYSASSGGNLSVVKELGGRQGNFLTTTEDGWVEWKVNVPTSGLYNIGFDYYPVEGKRSSIQRDLFIDGSLPFYEAHAIEFRRIWADAPQDGVKKGDEYRKDNQGNDIRPREVEKPEWRSVRVEDAKALYREPLEFYLTAGQHTIRLEAIREPIGLAAVSLKSPEVIPTYAAVKKAYEEKGYKEVNGVSLKFQAEKTYRKSDPTMRPEFGGDAISEPFAKGNMILNEFGGWRYRQGGQWASWMIDVPKSGLYKLGMRCYSGWDQKPSIRKLTIDGKLPFKESDELFIPYKNTSQQMYIPSDAKGTPYLYYLSKGKHVLTLEVRTGPIRETLKVLEDTMREMGKLSRQIILITGVDPDPNGEWELDKQIPTLVPTLRRLAKGLDEQVVHLTKVCGRRPTAANTLAMVSEQLKSMAEEPDSIPGRFDEFSTNQSSLGSWSLSLGDNPLIMDYVWVGGPKDEAPRAVPNFIEKFVASMNSFMLSFKKDYTGVGSIHEKGDKSKVIEVWIARGREWAEIIKDMVEDDFTPSTGIKVNINILPGGNTQVLLMSCISGRAPDVALGVPSSFPVDFAIRGALQNLNKYPDYKEIAKRFRPGALIPLRFMGGDWALPEDQDFSMMFYRQDIMEQIGLADKIPQTWEDVYKILPILQQSGLEFYFPLGNFTPFLFQLGGDYYTKDGLRSALDTPVAMKAFEEYCDLYTKYKLQKQADFFNRMRTGEMPIGIGSYWTYLMLSTAAPELTGWWKMVPMPGHRLPDGRIDRTIGGGSNVGVIFRASKEKEASWEFLKWWTGTDAQTRFGSELEALLGSEARWNSANVEALMNLPWPKEHKQAIFEQWKWFKEAPYVLGGYFSGRHISNAWNRVVLEGMNPREAIEMAVEDINKELVRKQEEFGSRFKDKMKQITSEGI